MGEGNYIGDYCNYIRDGKTYRIIRVHAELQFEYPVEKFGEHFRDYIMTLFKQHLRELRDRKESLNCWTKTGFNGDVCILKTHLSESVVLVNYAYLFSKINANCYKMASWNRVASAQDSSVAFLFGEGITIQDLIAAYGSEPEKLLASVVADIKADHAFDPKWKSAFLGAHLVYQNVDNIQSKSEYFYDLQFADYMNIQSAVAQTIGRSDVPIQNKTVTLQTNRLNYSLRPQEIITTKICF